MDSDKLKDKEDIIVEEDIGSSPEKSKFEKMLTRKEVKKFTVIPKKIKRLNDTKNHTNSGINLSANHIRLQLCAGNKMMVKNGSNKTFKIFSSKNACEE